MLRSPGRLINYLARRQQDCPSQQAIPQQASAAQAAVTKSKLPITSFINVDIDILLNKI
jgi:hypothetical protein